MSALAGRTVWVTGASSGIGAALAGELARRGARVAVTARRADALAGVVGDDNTMVALPGDVTDADRMREIVDDLVTRWGRIDIAVLNAGTYRPVTPDTFEPSVFREHFEVNVMGAVNCIAALLPSMRGRRSGRIAITSSVTGYVGLPLASAYGSTKAFLNAMSDSLRADLASSGVSVTLIAPGFVRTPLTAQNPFAMPGIIDADEAARIICDGLERGSPIIGVPRRALVFARAMALLPGWLRRAFVARIARRRARDVS